MHHSLGVLLGIQYIHMYKDYVHLGQDNKLEKDEANFKFGVIVHNIDLQLF